MVLLLGPKQMVSDGQDTVAGGNDGSLGPNASDEPMVLGFEVIVFRVGDDPSDFREHSTQVLVPLRGRSRLSLATALVVAIVAAGLLAL